ncbi:hypothetical protein CHARACLAT_016675, partial [Characodon lateralis]|nr:hypothetical protein [Characodon lateralis]
APVTIPAAPPPDPTPPVAEAVTWTLKSGKILIMVLAGSESHPATDYDPQSGALFATSPFLSNSTNARNHFTDESIIGLWDN